MKGNITIVRLQISLTMTMPKKINKYIQKVFSHVMASSVRMICAQKLIIFYNEWILSFLYINQSQLFFFFFFFVAKTFKTSRPCIFSVTFKNQLALRFITTFVNPLYTRLLYSYLICGLILNLVSLLRPKSFLFRVESIWFLSSGY